MDAAARDALTSALDAATTELGQAHADTGRAIETAKDAQHRAIAGKYETIARKLGVVIGHLEEHHGTITAVEQAITDARAAVLTAADADNPKEAVARWNDTKSKIDSVADANSAALDHLDRSALPLAQDATSGSGNDTVLAISQIKHSHQQAAKTGIGPAWKGIGAAVTEAQRIDSEIETWRWGIRAEYRSPTAGTGKYIGRRYNRSRHAGGSSVECSSRAHRRPVQARRRNAACAGLPHR